MIRWTMLLWLPIIMLAMPARAQTTGYNVVIGASPVTSAPPKVIDMSWAKDGPFGPVPGKRIQVFIMDGLFGRRGPGYSRTLDVSVRRGLPNILMFEDGRWQPLRPVGVHYGYEVDFAMRMTEVLPNETVGIIVGDGTAGKVFDTVAIAMQAAPCDIIAYVRLSRSALKGKQVFHEQKEQLGVPNLIVYDKSDDYDFNYPHKDRLEAIQDQARQMFREVYKQMNLNQKDN